MGYRFYRLAGQKFLVRFIFGVKLLTCNRCWETYCLKLYVMSKLDFCHLFSRLFIEKIPVVIVFSSKILGFGTPTHYQFYQCRYVIYLHAFYYLHVTIIIKINFASYLHLPQ